MYIEFDMSQPKLNDDGTAVKKANGQTQITFRYIVYGNAEELAEYKRIQGAFYRTNDKKQPLYFSAQPFPMPLPLCISIHGKLFVDTSDLDMAQGLIEKYGKAGEIMAKDCLDRAMLKIRKEKANLHSIGNAESVVAPTTDNPESID